jgi:predicted Rossmann fold flavoprotein
MRIAIVGGGPAGYFAALAAAAINNDLRITIFEATRFPLDKVRISGGGRCNVTHHCFDIAELVKNYPRGNKELRGSFNRFQPRDTVAWFAEHRVKLKTEEDGRMFPVTDRSSTIVDCLVSACARAGIRVQLAARVKSINAVSDGNISEFELELKGDEQKKFDRVLLATGGNPQGHKLAAALGHTIVPSVPSLFTFNVTDSRLQGLAGISFPDASLRLQVGKKQRLEQRGALLITHWGLSGPAVLKLSAWGARLLHENEYRAELTVNLLPDLKSEQVYETLTSFKEEHGRKLMSSGGAFTIPKRYWSRIAEQIGLSESDTWANVTKKTLAALVSELIDAKFSVSGKGVFKEEFVTCGGVSLREVDFDTMQSRVCPGLYFAGEILDIDGITGGFNFQSAWTTGWIAGSKMAAIAT